ncbi:hypothetical protein BS17DRAFT_879188 [Gyrodon lividus]|nr:hypothetical protein BS17DRAFT_879188 [Gyrodon lividus]
MVLRDVGQPGRRSRGGRTFVGSATIAFAKHILQAQSMEAASHLAEDVYPTILPVSPQLARLRQNDTTQARLNTFNSLNCTRHAFRLQRCHPFYASAITQLVLQGFICPKSPSLLGYPRQHLLSALPPICDPLIEGRQTLGLPGARLTAASNDNAVETRNAVKTSLQPTSAFIRIDPTSRSSMNMPTLPSHYA